jgi:intracellular septation protein
MSFRERYLNRHIVLELFPAAVFFVVNYGWGLMAATAAVMVATVVSVGIGIALERRLPVLAVTTLILVLLLGGASLVFDDAIYIKFRPTIGNCLFAAALAVGLCFRPSFLVRALGNQLSLTAAGWRVLTVCWIGFALSMAGLNEIVWRTTDTDTWVTIKTVMSPIQIVGYIVITRLIAQFHWQPVLTESDRAD